MLRFKLILFAISAVFFAGAQADIVPIKPGTMIPESNTQLNSVDGKTTTLKESMGKNGLIVIFSATTCPFVIGGESFAGWEKDYNSLYESAQKTGVNLVLINSNEAKREGGESFEDMTQQAKKGEYKMAYLLDKDSKVANAFNAKATPHVFYFDKTGKLIYEGLIDNSWDIKRKKEETYLLNAIENASAGKKIEPQQTPAKGCSIKRK